MSVSKELRTKLNLLNLHLNSDYVNLWDISEGKHIKLHYNENEITRMFDKYLGDNWKEKYNPVFGYDITKCLGIHFNDFEVATIWTRLSMINGADIITIKLMNDSRSRIRKCLSAAKKI